MWVSFILIYTRYDLDLSNSPFAFWNLDDLVRHWIQGSAWWDGVWKAETRCWGWENPRVRPSIWPASWEHMFQETWQPSHHIQVWKHSHADHVDFILFRRTMRKLVTDVKVIPGEEVAMQHQLLVCDMRIDVPPKSKRQFTLPHPSLKVWKLKDPQTSNHFQEVFNLHVSTSAGVADGATEDIWNNIKTGLVKTTEEVCGTTRPHRWRRETWWWNEHVEKAIAAKRIAFNAWKASKGTRASYDAAKRYARHAVHQARQEADKKVNENIDPKSSEVYRLANHFRRENNDVVGDKPVKNDAGEMSLSEDSKQKAWLEHYQRLLNVEFEFDWDPDHLSYQPPVEGPPIPVTIAMAKKAISQMKAGKAPGPSGIVVEIIRAAGDMGASMIHDLAVAIIRDGKVPSDWEQSFIVCLYKEKGDALERGSYRGLKLTEQVMKILERIVDGLIRQLVSIDDSQFGFVPGRGTTDAIFVVRQLQEKYLAANKRLYMAFVDLEMAFDRVPRKVIWWVVWRSGLCDWCRGCMQMHGAVSVLVRGTVKSLKWRLVFTKDQYSARCSSSLCLKPYHESSALGSPGRTSMPMTLLSSLNHLRNVSGGSWLGKKQWRRKDWE